MTRRQREAAQAKAWRSISGALDTNAEGGCSAADVCAVGFAEQENIRRVAFSQRIRRLGQGHRRPLAFYRNRLDSEPSAIGRVAAIETGGVRLVGRNPAIGGGTFIPWPGLQKVERAS